MLAAAYPVLTRKGDGSSPSGPNWKHWWSSGDDAALVRRKRGFDSHLVLWTRLLFDNLVKPCTHDVAVAYRLAMAEVRVQLPLGALDVRRVGKPG